MIYLVHHIKYVTVVTLIASILFFIPNVSMAEVSDPDTAGRDKGSNCQPQRVY